VTVSELASKSGYSRQRLNRLIDLGFAAGIERKTNGRLAITDETLATEWCGFLRRQKAARGRQNAERRESRNRPRIEKLQSLFQVIVNKNRQDVALSLSGNLDQIQREFKGDKQRFKYFAREWAQTKRLARSLSQSCRRYLFIAPPLSRVDVDQGRRWREKTYLISPSPLRSSLGSNLTPTLHTNTAARVLLSAQWRRNCRRRFPKNLGDTVELRN
jgi:hypothetical protein